MIRIQYLPDGSKSGVVRFYQDDDAPPMSDFQVVCTVNWESPEVVWVHGLMGKGNRKLWRDFVDKLHGLGVVQIRALRADGHILPRAKPHPDGRGLVLYVADLMRDPPDSAFTEP